MEIELIEAVNIDNKPAKKCPDFDSECVDVINHLTCWTGDKNLAPVDGYCPHVFNMINKP